MRALGRQLRDSAEGGSVIQVLSKLDRLFKSARQHGQGLVEYALVLVFISVVAVAIMTTVGVSVNNLFQRSSNAVVAP